MNYGTYEYFLNGEPTGVVETVFIDFEPPDRRIIKSIRDAKPYNTTIMVETVSSLDRFDWFSVSFHKDNFKVNAIYKFDDDTFYFQRKINYEVVEEKTIQIPQNCVIFPLMRCFQGQTILQVAENQQPTTVLVPDIQPTTKFEYLLKPTFDERTAKQISESGKLRVFNYLSKHYDENSEFHLDENGLLVFYKFHQSDDKIWTIKLKT
jgi:hypothetical protein